MAVNSVRCKGIQVQKGMLNMRKVPLDFSGLHCDAD
jgi:hypothetical protein